MDPRAGIERVLVGNWTFVFPIAENEPEPEWRMEFAEQGSGRFVMVASAQRVARDDDYVRLFLIEQLEQLSFAPSESRCVQV